MRSPVLNCDTHCISSAAEWKMGRSSPGSGSPAAGGGAAPPLQHRAQSGVPHRELQVVQAHARGEQELAVREPEQRLAETRRVAPPVRDVVARGVGDLQDAGAEVPRGDETFAVVEREVEHQPPRRREIPARRRHAVERGRHERNEQGLAVSVRRGPQGDALGRKAERPGERGPARDVDVDLVDAHEGPRWGNARRHDGRFLGFRPDPAER
jgi:hypothetical protein